MKFVEIVKATLAGFEIKMNPRRMRLTSGFSYFSEFYRAIVIDTEKPTAGFSKTGRIDIYHSVSAGSNCFGHSKGAGL